MTFEGAIQAMLLADATVAELVGDRVCLWTLPEGTAYPALTHFLVSEVPVQGVRGLSGTNEAMFQVSAWARSDAAGSGYTQARELCKAVRSALVGRSFTDAGSTVTVQITTEESAQVLQPDLPTDPWQIAMTISAVYTERKD